MRSVVRDTDAIITAYRCHAWAYLMGVPVREVIGELCGKKLAFAFIIFR